MPASNNTAVISALAARGEADPAAAFRARVVALTRYGLERQAAGDTPAAVEAFRGVTDLAPGLPMAWNNLALALTAVGDHDGALTALRCSVSLDSEAPGVWTRLAAAFLQLDRHDEADSACGEALSRDRLDAAAWQIRATACAARDDFAAAAEAFGRVLDIAGDSAPLRASRGAMLFRCGWFPEAELELAAALDLDPSSASTGEMLQLCRFILGALAGDMKAARGVYGADTGPDQDRVFKTALLYLDAQGHAEAARLVAEDWAACRPEDLEARHFRDATASRAVDRQPAELVAKHFDEIAGAFEARATRLAYDGPDRIAALLARHLTADGALSVLDAGCGTGLCATALRPYARWLAGVDLSVGMLDQARASGLYDALETADLLDLLARTPGAWDLVLAADAFPYLGRLEPVFDAVAQGLTPGGWFAFSTETHDGDDYVLRGNGRYAHGRAYVEALAAKRFDLVEHEATVLRREAGRPVAGDYFLLRRIG